MAQATPGHAHDHWHRTAPAIANLGGIVHELVEAGRDKVVELHLADRALTRKGGADTRAKHTTLGDRRVDDAIAELVEERPEEQECIAVRAADVFADDEHRRVGTQRVADAEHHRLEQGAARAIERRVGLERWQRRLRAE